MVCTSILHQLLSFSFSFFSPLPFPSALKSIRTKRIRSIITVGPACIASPGAHSRVCTLIHCDCCTTFPFIFIFSPRTLHTMCIRCSQNFTPKLLETYNKCKEEGKAFQVVYVSMDQNEEQFNGAFKEAGLPWLAVPYENKSRRQQLNAAFRVS